LLIFNLPSDSKKTEFPAIKPDIAGFHTSEAWRQFLILQSRYLRVATNKDINNRLLTY